MFCGRLGNLLIFMCNFLYFCDVQINGTGAMPHFCPSGGV
ncbi:hypothetical protein BURMUCF1_1971 [Burkholderia multivorans ATCC BAA-247]|nr:hypothetical protein BURMUCF1_1971 [Burkholderia multivorans ATCC BAA-247]